ncbi:MAG: hypothetical protein GKS02_07300 [Alphaproteobacteria bacterium]|nr:hypothetical protein [Alphaproteobacteria bacterium]
MSDTAVSTDGNADPAHRPEQIILTLLLFSGSAAFAVFGALATDNVDFFRTHATAWTSALLATPAFYIFARHFARAGLNHWWRLFWTFGWLMIVIHFYFGLGIMHFWDPVSVFQRQGFAVAGPIFLLQVTWLIDIGLAFIRRDWRFSTGWYKWWQLVAYLIAFLNFFVSLLVFQNDIQSLVIGILMTLVVVAALVQRWSDGEHAHE